MSGLPRGIHVRFILSLPVALPEMQGKPPLALTVGAGKLTVLGQARSERRIDTSHLRLDGSIGAWLGKTSR